MTLNFSTNNFNIVPSDVMINNILPYLSCEDLLGSTPYVCKQFHSLANNNALWQIITANISTTVSSSQNLQWKKIFVINLSDQLEHDLKVAIKQKNDGEANEIFKKIFTTGCRPPILDALTYITLPDMFIKQQFLDEAAYWIKQMKKARLELKGDNNDSEIQSEDIEAIIKNLNKEGKSTENLIRMLNLYMKEEDFAGAKAYLDIKVKKKSLSPFNQYAQQIIDMEIDMKIDMGMQIE